MKSQDPGPQDPRPRNAGPKTCDLGPVFKTQDPRTHKPEFSTWKLWNDFLIPILIFFRGEETVP